LQFSHQQAKESQSMKYIVLIMGLLVVGCGGRSLTEEEKKVVGSYEAKVGGATVKLVFLENGKVEHYRNEEGREWKIDGKKVHVVSKNTTSIYKIEPNGDLIWIALDYVGERIPKRPFQSATFKRIK
jgi:hypothetical protein